jgi:hypothetical protein
MRCLPGLAAIDSMHHTVVLKSMFITGVCQVGPSESARLDGSVSAGAMAGNALIDTGAILTLLARRDAWQNRATRNFRVVPAG